MCYTPHRRHYRKQSDNLGIGMHTHRLHGHARPFYERGGGSKHPWIALWARCPRTNLPQTPRDSCSTRSVIADSRRLCIAWKKPPSRGGAVRSTTGTRVSRNKPEESQGHRGSPEGHRKECAGSVCACTPFLSVFKRQFNFSF